MRRLFNTERKIDSGFKEREPEFDMEGIYGGSSAKILTILVVLFVICLIWLIVMIVMYA